MCMQNPTSWTNCKSLVLNTTHHLACLVHPCCRTEHAKFSWFQKALERIGVAVHPLKSLCLLHSHQSPYQHLVPNGTFDVPAMSAADAVQLTVGRRHEMILLRQGRHLQCHQHMYCWHPILATPSDAVEGFAANAAQLSAGGSGTFPDWGDWCSNADDSLHSRVTKVPALCEDFPHGVARQRKQRWRYQTHRCQQVCLAEMWNCHADWNTSWQV